MAGPVSLEVGTIVNLVLNAAMLPAIAYGLVSLRRLLGEWRRQHTLRTPAAAIYGMAYILSTQADELTPETRIRIYHGLLEQAELIVEATDAGAVVNKSHATPAGVFSVEMARRDGSPRSHGRSGRP